MTAIEYETDELGPAVMPEFASVQGLDELAAERPRRIEGAEKAATALPSDITLSKVALANTVKQLDRTVSPMIGVEPEAPEFMDGIAEGFYPLASYYSMQKPSVTTFWLIAGVTLLSYVAVKYNKVQKGASGEAVTSE